MFIEIRPVHEALLYNNICSFDKKKPTYLRKLILEEDQDISDSSSLKKTNKNNIVRERYIKEMPIESNPFFLI